ncbi:hypothetical protein LOD99_6024 [Oopsacas minuta]|uniref:Nodal modulator 1 n=1 Tax=Oopsacas minuta TaxID=111878 RepID=A0AAV7JNP3_9METZ|nr:hypothetical protein LOD99_6024 [Oopsacas minuta]
MLFIIVYIFLLLFVSDVISTEVIGCNGIIHTDYPIQFSALTIQLYNQDHILKYSTDCAPVDGYFFLPLTELEGELQQIFVEIVSPRGWNFREYIFRIDINYTDDICTAGGDLMFEFIGFSVEGGVVSYSMETGPNGVHIDLLKGEEIILTSQSTSDGLFRFENVAPGKYRLRGSHEEFNVSQLEFDFEVSKDSVNVGSPIQVYGYDVTGFVFHEKQGISGVQILLLSNGNTNALQSEMCVESMQNLENEFKQIPYLTCVAMSGADGMFTLKSISPGEYTIKPLYKSDITKFQLRPNQLKIAVSHSSLNLKDKFEVTGFEVYGSVIHLGINGELLGIENAEIELIGQHRTLKTTSDKFGSYRFDEIISDSYKVEAKLQGYEFEDVVINLSPFQTEITTLFPSKFEVSGEFRLAKQSLKSAIIQGVKIDFLKESLFQTELANDLSFKIFLPKGIYECTPNLSNELLEKGVIFSPESIQITVTKIPVSDIIFSQILSSIKIRTYCLSPCGVLNTILTSTNLKIPQTISTNEVTGLITYEDLLPGDYKVELELSERCWKYNFKTVSIGKDIREIEFYQNGYILRISSSHNASVDIVRSLGDYEDKISVQAGDNSFCLPLHGVYHITPISCHQFEPKETTFDTSVSGHMIKLTAVRHETITHIKADTNEISNENILLRVTSRDSGNVKTVTPDSITSEDTNISILEFVIFAETGENLIIEPQADQLLFLPSAYSVEITGMCPTFITTFLANRGSVIKGRVQPPIELVMLELRIDSPNEEVLRTHTNAEGEFSFGPLPKLDNYEIVPSSPGLLFEKREGNLFLVRRLGSVAVSVVDELNRPLSSVLVSMHCGRIRMNNLTSDAGSLLYSKLQICEYYVKPSLKEYSFTPTGEMILVELDSELEIRFVGHKIHYSAYGFVTSLNDHPQGDIEVLARGLTEGCTDIVEKGTTDQKGNFRIQGLKSNCQYHISIENSRSPHIENIIPGSFMLLVGSEDLKDIHFCIYNRTEKHEMTGNIEGPDEFMDRMQVKLYQETTRGLVHASSVQVGTGGFFKYSLSRGSEDKEFILMVDSKTRIQGYTVSSDQSVVSFLEGSRHTSVTFRVDKVVELDKHGGSFFQLSAALIFIFVVSRFSRLIKESFQNIFGK